MPHPHRLERTTAVHRDRPFRVGVVDLQRVRAALEARRGEGPVLAVAVVDASGARVRVVAAGDAPTVLTVGRHPACDLPVLQADASMRHAVVVGDDDGVRILDLSSSFGLTGRSVAAVGRWAFVRAGDSVVAAAVLDDTDDLGDVGVLCLAGHEGAPLLALDVGPRPPTLKLLQTPPTPPTAEAPARPRRGACVEAGSVVSLARIGRAPLLLGRDTRCDVRFTNDRVSRVHAALVPVRVDGARRVIVVDVGSTNGTTVLHVDDGAIHEVALGPAGRGQLVRAGDMVELAGERVRLVGAVDDGEGGVG